MKYYKLTLAMAMMLIWPFIGWSQGKKYKEPKAHQLTEEWQQYDDARDKDLPQTELDILSEIMEKAKAGNLVWDFYDAADQYKEVGRRRNWKENAAFQNQFRENVKSFPNPLAYLWYMYNQRSSNLLSYINENQEILKSSRDPYLAFQVKQRNDFGLEFRNDYENSLMLAILSYFSQIESAKLLQEELNGLYPYAALVEYIQADRSVERKKNLEAFINRYSDKAVSLFAESALLWDEFNTFEYHGDKEFVDLVGLRSKCEDVNRRLKKFKGEEKELAKRCDISKLIETLDSRSFSAAIEDRMLNVQLRNLSSITASILREGVKRPVWKSTLINQKCSYYKYDSLQTEIPLLPDGEYVLNLKANKSVFRLDYIRHTLSVAWRETADGQEIYAAEYQSGKPVNKVDMLVTYDDGSKKTYRNFKLNGFTALGSEIATYFNDGKIHHVRSLQVFCVDDDGVFRKSDEIGFSIQDKIDETYNSNIEAAVLTDCGVYMPGSEVHFKGILYEDCELVKGAESHVLSNRDVTLVLIGAGAKEITRQTLCTNEFGSVSGSFTLPKDEKHGVFGIDLYLGYKKLTTRDIRVEEYVLPTFEIKIDEKQPDWFPDDKVTIHGRVLSYSGRSLKGAEASWSLIAYGNGLSKDIRTFPLTIADDGSFTMSFYADPIKEEEFFSNYYEITVKVADSTGEVKEANISCRVSKKSRQTVDVLEKVVSEYTGMRGVDVRWPKYSIIGDKLHIRVSSGPVASDALCRYKLFDYAGSMLSEGLLEIDKDSVVNLPSDKPALYKVEAITYKKAQNGIQYSSSPALFSVLVLPSETESTVPEGIESFFRTIEDRSSFGVQFGASDAPIWAIVELFDRENHVLSREIRVLNAEKSALTLKYPYLDSYPEAVALSIFYFRNGREFKWSHVFKRQIPKTNIPLEFSRFTDTTGPGAELEFSLKTEADSECAIAVFDKTTETYGSNLWRALYLNQGRTPRLNIGSISGYDRTLAIWEMHKNNKTMLAKAPLGKLSAKSVTMTEQVEEQAIPFMRVEDDRFMKLSMADTEEYESLKVRDDFRDVLAFEPHVQSDSNGVATFRVKTSDKLATYIVNVLAHDRRAHSATMRREFMVTMPVQLSMLQPTYLYQGDRFVLNASLSNEGREFVDGNILFTITDGSKVLLKQLRAVKVEAGGATSAWVELGKVPACESGNLGIKVAFLGTDAAGLKLSDAVYVEVPVREASQMVEEAHSAVLTAGADKAKLVASLRSQFKNVPSSSIKQREISIADMVKEVMEGECEPRSEDAISLMAAITVRHLTGKGQTDALVAKLLDCRNVDGGFGWRAGMPSSAAVTAYILESAAQFRDRDHELDAALDKVLEDAVNFLDACEFAGQKLPVWRGGISLQQYTYVRSFYADVAFDQKVDKDAKNAMRDYFSLDNALQGALIAKVRRLVTLDKLIASDSKLASEWGLQREKKLQERIRGDIESLAQYAVAHKSGGEYFPNAVMPFRGLFESEAYAHSMICNALAPYRPELADGIRLWLMVQKETQKWPTDPACVNAVLSILDGSASLLDTKVLVLEGSAKLPFSKIARSGNGMSVVQSWSVFRDGAWLQGVDFNSGEKVRVTYNLWSEENRSFVRFKAPFPACLQPIDKLSGYRWGCYRDLKAGEIEYWYQSFPEENTTVTEEFYAVRPGTFQSAVPSVVSSYAPHYSAIDKEDVIFVSQTQ